MFRRPLPAVLVDAGVGRSDKVCFLLLMAGSSSLKRSVLLGTRADIQWTLLELDEMRRT